MNILLVDYTALYGSDQLGSGSGCVHKLVTVHYETTVSSCVKPLSPLWMKNGWKMKENWHLIVIYIVHDNNNYSYIPLPPACACKPFMPAPLGMYE